MAMITVICPFCGTQVQVEEGQYTHCPVCATELNTAGVQENFAFAAQDAPVAQDMQFAPPPVPAAVPEPLQMQQPDVIPLQPMPQQYRPQFTPMQLQEAEKKRKNWHIMNCGLMGFQTLLFALGLLLAVKGTRFGIPLILTWVLTLPFFVLTSMIKRPDEAYIEKKPFIVNKVGQGFVLLVLSAGVSAAVGAILFAILAGLLGMY